MEEKRSLDLIYTLNEKPRSKLDFLVYSLQWIMILVYPVVMGYSILGVGLGLNDNELALFMSQLVFMIGLSTLIQVLLGHKLSMISGPNIIPMLAIVSAFGIGGLDYALGAFNAYIIAGLIVALLGAFGIINYISRVWSNLVSGSMIMMIGLSTSVAGLLLITKSNKVSDLVIGITLALICGLISIKFKGMVASISVLITITLGYLVYILMGDFNWTLVTSQPILTYPKIFPYGLIMPELDLIIIMIIVNLMSAINLYGNIEGYSNLVGYNPTNNDKRRYFIVFGLIDGVLASILGVPSHTAYGENLGFITLTKIAARFFLIVAAIAFIVLSIFGNVGGFMAAMPNPVAGSILLGVASTLIGLGAKTWMNEKEFKTREIFIVGFSIFLSFGLSFLEESFYLELPRLVTTILKNPVITVILLVMILEQLLFKKEGNVESQVKNI